MKESSSIAAHHALAIAQADAAGVYPDLNCYRILMALESDGWHVDYVLKDAKLKGGGPRYVIDRDGGAILSKRYYQ